MVFTEKYRPKKFSEVRGQDTTVTILKNILKQKKGLHFSYVFSGPWGSGKSTLARILAKAILCDNLNSDSDACGSCSSCLEFDEGRSALGAYREIDAASNSSKDFVKELVENGQIRTFSGKKRIWLFDEAHQLTSAAVDVLLKPVEDFSEELGEKDIVCIFCTTAPERLKSTIRSRCLKFEVDLVTDSVVHEHIIEVANKEGMQVSEPVITAIVREADGHLRDALQLLEFYNLSDQSEAVLYKISNQDLSDTIADSILMFQEQPDRSIAKIIDLSKKTLPTKLYRVTLDVIMSWIQKEVNPTYEIKFTENTVLNLTSLGVLLQCFAVRPASDAHRERYLSDLLKAFTTINGSSGSGFLNTKKTSVHLNKEDSKDSFSTASNATPMESREYFRSKDKLHIENKFNGLGKIRTSDGCSFPKSAISKTPVDEPTSGPITLKVDKTPTKDGMDNLALSEVMRNMFIDSPESMNKNDQG